MTTQVSEMLEATGCWPIEDQLALLDGLWDRMIDSGWTPPLSEESKAELDRRLAELDTHPERSLTWEQVEKRLILPS